MKNRAANLLRSISPITIRKSITSGFYLIIYIIQIKITIVSESASVIPAKHNQFPYCNFCQTTESNIIGNCYGRQFVTGKSKIINYEHTAGYGDRCKLVICKGAIPIYSTVSGIVTEAN